MSSAQSPCPPLDGATACGSLPPGFARLRYFFGKRLAVADFVDEQRYHAGKMRFHNQRLHGSGVLCGLGARLLEPGSTLLRIGKGAALDACGREIVIGYDQCIDVDAWYRRERDDRLDADPAATWPAELLDDDGRLPLCVLVRYRECPVAPEPAPRDPCACTEGGCDYGRVREEFELALVHADEAAGLVGTASHPAAEALDALLGGMIAGRADLDGRLAQAVTAACAGPVEDEWLLLACLRAEPSTDLGQVDAIHDLTVRPPVLLQSAVLQELALRHIAALGEPLALVSSGPAITAVTLEQDSGDPGTYLVRVALSAPLVATTVAGDAFALRGLDLAAGWQAPATPVTTSYVAAPAPALVITVLGATSFLNDGSLYRLSLQRDPAEPMVDAHLRPLRPLGFSWSFSIEDDGGVLRMVPAPQAP
jgi:hypothetical protein